MNDTLTDTGAWQDPIVAEVRATRQALFAAAGNDIREFCRRLREEQDRSGHAVATRASGRVIPRPEDAA
jgi:hypothetical protein